MVMAKSTLSIKSGNLDKGSLAGILNQSFPCIEITNCETVDIYRGTNLSARVILEYADRLGPPSVFVKSSGGFFSKSALMMLGALYKEAEVARQKTNLPFRHPVLYGSLIDKKSFSFLLAMEDITGENLRINTPADTLSLKEARSGLEELAKLHARYWNRDAEDKDSFIKVWKMAKPLWPVSALNLERGVSKFYSLLKKDKQFISELSDSLVDNESKLLSKSYKINPMVLNKEFFRISSLYASGPLTLLHGDPHIGNTYTVDHEWLGFFDLQLLRRGNWSSDIGYFLLSSLSIQDRRRYLDELLDYYFGQLALHGIALPSEAQAKQLIRCSPIFGLASWIHTFSFGIFQKREYCLEMIKRFLSAYYDLETSQIYKKR